MLQKYRKELHEPGWTLRVAACAAGWAILAVGCTGSRDVVYLSARSAVVEARWGPPWAEDLAKSGYQAWQRGQYAAAASFYQRGLSRALRDGRPAPALRFETNLAGCQLAQFQYRRALASFLDAKKLAAALRDHEVEGIIALNISSVYLQIFAPDQALQAAEDALKIIDGIPHPFYEPQLRILLARLLSKANQKQRALALFRQGVEQAQMRGETSVAATGLAQLGQELLEAGDSAGAEQALVESYRLRLMTTDKDLLSSCYQLAELKLAQGDLRTASSLVERTLDAPPERTVAIPRFQIYGLRGRIRAAEGRLPEALEDFRTAIRYAREWRGHVLPADAFLTETNAALEDRVYREFIRTAALLYRRTGDSRLAAESFRAEEENRAQSLQESRAARARLLDRLGPEYAETLARLGAVEVRTLDGSTRAETEARELRLRLAEMENAADLQSAVRRGESFRTQNSLNHFQYGLSKSDLVLSFHLDESGSYLWTVTRNRFSLYALPARRVIAGEVAAFRDAIQGGRPEAEACGESLFRSLFAKLDPEEVAKPHWLLELDGPLFELPFAALVVKHRDTAPVFLMEQHSLQIVPALWILESGSSLRSFPTFLGVGDPIYNTADARWGELRPATARPEWTRLLSHVEASTRAEPLMLARLAGSGQEVKQCSRLWNGWRGRSTTLVGASATLERFREELRQAPAVIHLATHVLLSPSRKDEALVAFGLDKTRQPDMLAASDIAALRLSGPLVVLDGCATSNGVARPGAGLIGLTRAWLLAGASGVIATEWPVPDNTGELLCAFYRHLKREPGMAGESPADALRSAQIEMAASKGWRSEPRYWAAYSLTGGTR